MNGLPLAIDLSCFAEARATQLCFGENEFQIHFDNDVHVVVESNMIFRSILTDEVRIERYAPAASLLCRIVGIQVSQALRTDDGGMMLRFHDGGELHLLNDNSQFESFQIHTAGQIYVA
jgi:hypothetical protein